MEVSTSGGGRQSRTLCYISSPPPSPDPALAHHARPCVCARVSHMAAEGFLSSSSVVGERSAAGVDTNAYLSTQISSSRLRPRRLTWADGRTLQMRQLLVCTQQSRSHG